MGVIENSGVLCSISEAAPCIIDNGASCGGPPARQSLPPGGVAAFMATAADAF